MGVNGLWPALDQASKPVAAEDLRGKVLAVDLSIWLVEACTSKLLKTEHKHPHLFLTLSRASFLLRHGALPIVVVEGGPEAVDAHVTCVLFLQGEPQLSAFFTSWRRRLSKNGSKLNGSRFFRV